MIPGGGTVVLVQSVFLAVVQGFQVQSVFHGSGAGVPGAVSVP